MRNGTKKISNAVVRGREPQWEESVKEDGSSGGLHDRLMKNQVLIKMNYAFHCNTCTTLKRLHH